MKITSKPNDGEPIIERQKGPLGQELLIASQSLTRFFADLVSANNGGSDETTIINSTTTQIQMQSITEIEILRRELDDARGQISALVARNYGLETKHRDLESKLNNLEHLCLSNLAR